MKRVLSPLVIALLAVTFAVRSYSEMSQLSSSMTTPPPSTPLTADQVVGRLVRENFRRARALQGYRSTRKYDLIYRGFPSGLQASMSATVEYVAPATKTYQITSESGSKLLLNRVLHKLLTSEVEAADDKNRSETELSPRNYRFTMIGTETMDGRNCYALKVEPLRNNKFLYLGTVWVDAEDFAVVRIKAQPAKNPSFWISKTQIEHVYQKHGEFWLPASNRSTSSTRLGGTATLTIAYEQYQFPPY